MDEPAHLTAARSGYDAVAGEYAEAFRAELAQAPLDRALLAGFAELHLDVRGIDLSSAMVDLARREHPHLGFDVGEMGSLDRRDGELAGVVSWYSLIHVPGPDRGAVLEEFHRVLRPGGTC